MGGREFFAGGYMEVVFYDGSTEQCSKIEVAQNGFILDDHRLVPFYCVLRIMSYEDT